MLSYEFSGIEAYLVTFPLCTSICRCWFIGFPSALLLSNPMGVPCVIVSPAVLLRIAMLFAVLFAMFMCINTKVQFVPLS